MTVATATRPKRARKAKPALPNGVPVLALNKIAAAGACQEQFRRVKTEWPDGVPLELATLARARALGLDLEWAANHLLSDPARAEYERVRGQAWAEYERVSGPAWAEYERVRRPARAEYERVRGQAWAEYERVSGQAWAEYERVRGPAWAEYERVRGQAWAEYERVSGPARAEYERVSGQALIAGLISELARESS